MGIVHANKMGKSIPASFSRRRCTPQSETRSEMNMKNAKVIYDWPRHNNQPLALKIKVSG